MATGSRISHIFFFGGGGGGGGGWCTHKVFPKIGPLISLYRRWPGRGWGIYLASILCMNYVRLIM